MAGIVNIVIVKRLKENKPIKFIICKISVNQDKLQLHKFHGKPVKIFPLIKSDKESDKENNIKEEKLQLKNLPTTKIVTPVKRAKNAGISITANGISILKLSSNVNEYAIQNVPLKKNAKPKTKPKINKFLLKGFFL